MKRLFAISLLALCIAPVLSASELPFLQDNYGKALLEARQRNLPIFVEVWAPW